MHTGMKPLTRFIEDHYKGDFPDFIRDAFSSGQMPEDAGICLDGAYLEGFLDGVRLIIWAADN